MRVLHETPPAEPRPSALPAPDSRAALAVILGLGCLVFLPALLTPYLLDDVMQRAMVHGTFVTPRGPFGLYDFLGDADRPTLLERGLLPWWTDPHLTVRFLRPLSSALRWAEERTLPDSPVLFHLHSLLWWVAAVLGARRLFRRAMAPRAVWLASCMFALGPWHALPIAWLANREALLSLALGAFALDAYLRWREHGRVRDACVSAALFGLGLMAGEYTLCFGGYVVAFEVLARRDGPLVRLRGLLPFLVPTACYLVAHVTGGYGTSGSAFYTDPLHQPLTFLSHSVERAASLLLQGWLTMGTRPWGISLTTAEALLLGSGLVAVVALPVRRALTAAEPAARLTSTWLFAGALLAMIPVLAVAPAPRLLGIPALGITATIALVLDQAWFPPVAPPRRGLPELSALVATALGFAQLVHGPMASMIGAETLRTSAAITEASVETMRARLEQTPRTQVTALRGTGSTFFVPWGLALQGRLPTRWSVLAETQHVLVRRVGERTLELVAGDSLFPASEVSLYRSPLRPMVVGEVVHGAGMTVTVLEVSSDGPRRARFEFDDSLEAPGFLAIDDGRDGVKEARLPAIGFGAPFDF